MHSACKVEAHRQMLPDLKQRQPGAIGGLQVDRAEVAAFLFDARHSQRPPAIDLGLGLQACVRLRPDAGQQTAG